MRSEKPFRPHCPWLKLSQSHIPAPPPPLDRLLALCSSPENEQLMMRLFLPLGCHHILTGCPPPAPPTKARAFLLVTTSSSAATSMQQSTRTGTRATCEMMMKRPTAISAMTATSATSTTVATVTFLSGAACRQLLRLRRPAFALRGRRVHCGSVRFGCNGSLESDLAGGEAPRMRQQPRQEGAVPAAVPTATGGRRGIAQVECGPGRRTTTKTARHDLRQLPAVVPLARDIGVECRW